MGTNKEKLLKLIESIDDGDKIDYCLTLLSTLLGIPIEED